MGFSGTTKVTGNTLTRTGGFEPNWNDQFGALWLFADTSSITAPVVVKDMVIQDSTYSGLYISGANQVQGISFGVEDNDKLLDEARTKAIADARRKAELYAAAAGVGVGKVLSISEVNVGWPAPRV